MGVPSLSSLAAALAAASVVRRPACALSLGGLPQTNPQTNRLRHGDWWSTTTTHRAPHARRRRSGRTERSGLHMSPAPLKEETTARSAASADEGGLKPPRTGDPIRSSFEASSAVRSTTQTDAIGRKRKRSDAGVPPEVLRPFSLLLLSQFVLFLGVGAVIPTIPLYGQSIGLSSASNGIVISAPAVALLLVSRAAGERADRGRKGAMMGGMALIALSDVGTAFSADLASLVLARLGLGLGRGFAEAGERGMLADLAGRTPKLRGRALALQQACVALGISLGAPLGGGVVEKYGARSAFLCVSAAAVCALAIYAALPETIVGEAGDGEGRDDAAGDDLASNPDSETSNGAGADWLQLLNTSSAWRSLAIAQSGTSFGYACKIAIIPVLASAYLGGPTGAGLLLSAAGLAGLVGAPLGGLLTDVAGSRVAASVAGFVSGVSLALIPVGLSLRTVDETGSSSLVEGLSSSSSLWHPSLAGWGPPEATALTALVLLWSVGASAQGPALTAQAQERAPLGAEATALGLPRAVGDGTYIAAPLILGYVADQWGDEVPGLSCAVAGAAICLGSAFLLLTEDDDDGEGERER
ncbi:hypothetical protein ACHAWF_012205 [Thalassiosira exigua]